MAYNYSYFLGATFGMASLGGAMVNTMAPILTFILLVLLGVRMMSVYEGLALCLGIAGVLIMLHIWQFEIEKIINSHNLYFFASALIWSIFSIISTKVENTSALLLSFYMYGATIVIDGVLFVDFSAIVWEQLNITAWGNLIALSLFSTVFANTIYFLGIKRLGVAKVSIFGFLIPFASIFLGAIFLEESIDIFVIIGTILTLFAIRILNHTTSKR